MSSPASEPETVYASKTLASCLSLLFSRPAAEVVDLGPVIGSNVTFLGDRVDCKIHVEDLYADIDRHIKQDKLDQLPRFLSGRFPLPDASIDAVLGWDIFDYIDPLAASALAEELIRLVRPGGVLLAFFGAVASDHPRYVKYFIEDAAHLRYRSYPAPRRRWILHNRDISLMFAGLELCDSVLLKSGVREMLFRKRPC
ncbi:MAG: hypothetical protein DME02_22250 [Candidatus Rokuibacteriota bacterium]|nr:MAG: hypothetical protein DME02_22250 [Candidatus Rokubacteria bacterium]